MSRIAFIGLGNMGTPMAGNLVAAGHEVAGHDLDDACIARAKERGVSTAGSARAACDGAAAVVTMLPAGRHVLAVYDDILGAVAPGTLLIDSSTIDVESARDAHARAAGAGALSIDAPVSGGVGGAEAGTLTFMAGGSAEAFAAAEAILAPMAGRVVHCGEAGAGQAAKICNNMLLGISMIGTAEAFNLADALGLSRQALFDVASTSSGRCWSLDTYCPVPGPVPTSPANHDYRPGFASELMLKDLGLAREAADSEGAHTPLGRAAAELYGAFAAAGGEGRDFSAIIEFLRERGRR